MKKKEGRVKGFFEFGFLGNFNVLFSEGFGCVDLNFLSAKLSKLLGAEFKSFIVVMLCINSPLFKR